MQPSIMFSITYTAIYIQLFPWTTNICLTLNIPLTFTAICVILICISIIDRHPTLLMLPLTHTATYRTLLFPLNTIVSNYSMAMLPLINAVTWITAVFSHPQYTCVKNSFSTYSKSHLYSVNSSHHLYSHLNSTKFCNPFKTISITQFSFTY
jgi:hypothetical protein